LKKRLKNIIPIINEIFKKIGVIAGTKNFLKEDRTEIILEERPIKSRYTKVIRVKETAKLNLILSKIKNPGAIIITRYLAKIIPNKVNITSNTVKIESM
jgi:hypothetical protein